MNLEEKNIRYSRQIVAFQQILERFALKEPLQRVLVLGCGNGLEAGYVSRLLGVKVFGVDLNKKFHAFGRMNANLLSYDGKRLPFPDNYFDAVYSYHVLEHVRDVTNVMAETRRVLRPRGLFYVGVPNKSRLFAYTGMNDKSVYQKVRQNVRDWSKRLQGEWDNSLGAHAGFREAELTKQLARFFSRIVPVTRFYYAAKWSKYQSILKLVFKFSLDKIMLPSLYVLASGQKRDYHEEYQDWRY